MTNITNSFQNTLAKAMLAPFLSKAGMNSIFLLILVVSVYPVIISEYLKQDSFLLAICPVIVVSIGLWLNFINRIRN